MNMSSNPPSKVASAATANPDSDDDYDDLDGPSAVVALSPF